MCAPPARLAELTKLKGRLDPFELARIIDGKLKRYQLANRRLSPGSCPLHNDRRKWLQPETGVEKPLGGKAEKQAFPPSLEIPPRARGIPTFPHPLRRGSGNI
jgi:hypothetical protein